MILYPLYLIGQYLLYFSFVLSVFVCLLICAFVCYLSVCVYVFHFQVYILPVVVSGGTVVVTTSFLGVGGQKNKQLSTDFADDPVPADLFTEMRVLYIRLLRHKCKTYSF